MVQKASKKVIIPLVIVIAISSLLAILSVILVLSFPVMLYLTAKVEVVDDISKYNEVFGKNAKTNYNNKWMDDSSIFPKEINNKEEVKDFKMVYYNPWDAQYLSYLVIDYESEQDYNVEIDRLLKAGVDKYIGYYSVTGFTKYDLVAMKASDYYGFVYALTDKDKNEIIYVEIIFCNYFMDLDYNKYINKDYLPDGFDATLENPYGKKHSP